MPFRRKKRKNPERESPIADNQPKDFLEEMGIEDDRKQPEEKSSVSQVTDSALDKVRKKVAEIDSGSGVKAASDEVYTRVKKRTVIILIMVAILAGYIFFFTSPYWMNQKKSTYEATPLNEEQVFVSSSSTDSSGQEGSKSMTIQSWIYSPSQAMMEVKLIPESTIYDGKDQYEFRVTFPDYKGLSSAKPSVETRVNDDNLIVLLIHNVPAAKWKTVDLQLYYQGETNQEALLDLYALNESMSKVNSIPRLSSNEYRAQIVDQQITQLQKQITSLQKQIRKNEQTIANMDSRAGEINENLALDTDSEKKKDQEQIEDIHGQESELQGTNKSLNKQISGIRKQIAQLQKKKDALINPIDSGDLSESKESKDSDKLSQKTSSKASDVAIATTKPEKKAEAPKSGKSGKKSSSGSKKTKKSGSSGQKPSGSSSGKKKSSK